MKKVIRLTESDLVKLIKRVINEGRTYTYDDAWEKAFKEKVYNPCNLYAGKIVIGLGNQGPLVAALQHELNRDRKEYPGNYTSKEDLVVDGIFGKKTKQMVIDLQKSAADTPDGIIGKNTFRSLNAQIWNSGGLYWNNQEDFEERCPGLKYPF